MERLSYLLDTNAISDYLNRESSLTSRVRDAIARGHLLYLTPPVHYEVLRGLLKAGASRKLNVYQGLFVPQLDWLSLADEDWRQAASLWAMATRQGRQLSDVDYLIAAMSIRLDAIIVSDDNDFDALPVKRENWRN